MNKALAAAAITAFAISLIAAAAVFLQDSQQEAAATEESFNYTVRFCSMEDCLQALASELKSAKKSVSCALYGIDNSLLSDLSSFYSSNPEIAITVVVDENARIADSYLKREGGFVFKRDSKGIMHNKYCTIDDSRIITGSFNPTAASKGDYNNMLMINSTALASFYNGDFERLKSGSRETPTTAAVANKEPKLKTAILNKTAVEVYFCPQDDCAGAVERELEKATSSITFAAYSFTHPEIANELALKASEGVAVAGVIEKSTTGSKYSKHEVLAKNGVLVVLESSKRLMHHKFFLIDNETVITGSFNPTENAAHRNDENIIIIDSKEVVERYAEETARMLTG